MHWPLAFCSLWCAQNLEGNPLWSSQEAQLLMQILLSFCGAHEAPACRCYSRNGIWLSLYGCNGCTIDEEPALNSPCKANGQWSGMAKIKVTFWHLWPLLLRTSDHSLHLWLGGAIYQDYFCIGTFWKPGVQWFLALVLLCKTIWWKLGVLNERCKPGLAWIWFSIAFGSFISHWMFSRFLWKSQDCHHTV